MKSSVRSADKGVNARHQMGNISHIRGGRKVAGFPDFRIRCFFFHIIDEYLIQIFTACKREHTGERLNFHFRTDRHTACTERRIDTLMLFVDSVHRLRPDIEFHTHIGRHIIHQIAAFGDNRVDTDHVVFFKRFTERIDSHDTQAGRIQSIDSFMRCVCRMCRLAHILHRLSDKTVT